MTRVANREPAIHADCSHAGCKRKRELAEFVQRQREMRATYGSNVELFPSLWEGTK